MINFTKFILTSLLLGLIINKVYSDLAPVFVPTYNIECSNDFATTCDLQCPNGNYLLDEKGCPTCACSPDQIMQCPQIKCRANCGDAGYQLDENGCQTCKCVKKENVQCSRVMCRMFCQNGFKRDENGCPYCACNELPQTCPELNCVQTCTIGYRKDYNGCQTCECECPSLACPASTNDCKNGLKKNAEGCPICECDEQQEKIDDLCLPLDCDLNCKYGLQRDESGCKLCSCNLCPQSMCRMYCIYGFRRNNDGCEVCECDWTPVAEKIPCSERIPCPGTRVCNLNLRLCETVDPDKVNWFLYDFEVPSNIFNDEKFVQTFKNGLINNIAAKYNLEIPQIAISSIQENGLTSFQIMPFFSENMENFERKMDQIDNDLNSHEFRAVLPAVTRVIEDGNVKYPVRIDFNRLTDKLKSFTRTSPKSMICMLFLLFGLTTLIIFITYIHICRRNGKYPKRSESKLPIYDTSYHQTATDEDSYHAVQVCAPDGTKYCVIESDDMQSSKDKRVSV